MPNAEKSKIGRPLNSICPTCKTGRLKPVTNHVTGNNGIIGSSGRSWDFHVIERLGCTHCGISYESCDRGKRVNEMLQRQAESFKNTQDQQPDVCPGCGGSCEKGQIFGGRRFPGVQRKVLKTYLFCPDCVRVVYVTEPEKTESPSDLATLGDEGDDE